MSTKPFTQKHCLHRGNFLPFHTPTDTQLKRQQNSFTAASESGGRQTPSSSPPSLSYNTREDGGTKNCETVTLPCDGEECQGSLSRKNIACIEGVFPLPHSNTYTAAATTKFLHSGIRHTPSFLPSTLSASPSSSSSPLRYLMLLLPSFLPPLLLFSPHRHQELHTHRLPDRQ